MGNTSSSEQKQANRGPSRDQRKEEKRAARELAAATAKLAASYGHSSLAEAYLEQAVTDRTSDARQVQNALLNSKVEEDSRQEQQTYRNSLRGASQHSGRAVERGPGSGAARRADARSNSSGASTSGQEQPNSPGQPVSPPMCPNRNSSTGHNRLQTVSRSSADSSVSAMVQRDGSKTSAFLARAETVLASQRRPDSQPLSPTQSHKGPTRKTASLRRKEEEELQMALAVSASEAAAVAAALQEPISIEDAEAIAAAQAELDAASEATTVKTPRRTVSVPATQQPGYASSNNAAAASAAATPAGGDAACAATSHNPVPMRERFVPLTVAQKADIEATEVKERIQRSRSAAAAAAKFQFIADDEVEDLHAALPEPWERKHQPQPEAPPSKHRLRAEAFAAKADLPPAPDTPARSPSVRVASTASFSSSQRSEATSMDSLELPARAAGPRATIIAAARRARASQGLSAADQLSSRDTGVQSLDSEADKAVLEYLQRQHGALQSGLDGPPPRSARAAGIKPLARHSPMPTHHEPSDQAVMTPRGGRKVVL